MGNCSSVAAHDPTMAVSQANLTTKRLAPLAKSERTFANDMDLGASLRAQGHLKEAAAAYSDALDLQPLNVDAHHALADVNAVLRHKAWSCTKKRAYEQFALTHLRSATQSSNGQPVSPTATECRRQFVIAYRGSAADVAWAADGSVAKREWDQVKNLFKTLYANKEASAADLRRFGDTAYAFHWMQTAHRLYAAASKREPNCLTDIQKARYVHALERKNHDFTKRTALLQSLAETSESKVLRSWAHTNLGVYAYQSYHYTGDTADAAAAAQAWRTALALNPHNSVAYTNQFYLADSKRELVVAPGVAYHVVKGEPGVFQAVPRTLHE